MFSFYCDLPQTFVVIEKYLLLLLPFQMVFLFI